ncbi:MAG: ribonuclease III [Magnetococcales bacterium]|nr:ribonuclease III [Magnetococcales bacterium]
MMGSVSAIAETMAEAVVSAPKGDTPLDQESSLEALQQKLGYRFANRDILCRALTHRSYLQDGPPQGLEADLSSAWSGMAQAAPGKVPGLGSGDQAAGRPCALAFDRSGHNERLEFLGDAVLGLAISDQLFRRYPEQPEGVLSHWRATLVNTQSLARMAHTHDLGRFLHMGRGELLSGGRGKTSLLGNAVEALLGAIYLDGGYTAAYQVIQHLFADLLHESRPGQWEKDYKSMLQERLQGAGERLPDYSVVAMHGAPHERTFHIACVVDRGLTEQDPLSRIGSGRSKRSAEQSAAKAVFAALYQEPPWDGQALAQTDPLDLTRKESDHT